MNQIFIKHEELDDFIQNSRVCQKLQDFFKQIESYAPLNLKQDISPKSFKVVEIQPNNFSLSGAIPLKLVHISNKAELNDFLSSYVMFLEADSFEIASWKQSIHALYS